MTADTDRHPAPRATVEHAQFPGIELLRFLCAFSVLCWHFQHFFFRSEYFVEGGFDTSRTPFYPVLKLFLEHRSGPYAVDVFWAISGFIFVWKYAGVVHQRRVQGQEFFLRRFSRLYPLHLLTLLLVLVLQSSYMATHRGESFCYQNNDAVQFVFQLLFSSYWLLQSTVSFNGPIWSVMIEGLVYGLFFGIAGALNLQRLRNCLLVTAFLGAIWYEGVVLSPDLASCALQFFIGGCVYLLGRRLQAGPRTGRSRTLRHLAHAASLVIVVLTIADVYLDQAIRRITIGDDHVLEYLHFVFTPALLLGFAALPLRRPRVEAAARRLGNLTYSSYLIHFPLQLVVVCLVDAWRIPREALCTPAFFLAYLGVVLVLSDLTHRRFELPAQQFLRRRLGSGEAVTA